MRILAYRQDDGRWSVAVWTKADGEPAIVAQNMGPAQEEGLVRDGMALLERMARMKAARLN